MLIKKKPVLCYTLPSASSQSGATKRIVKMWVTDAVYLANVQKLAVFTTCRDVWFYDVSTTSFMPQYHVYALPFIPTAAHFWHDPLHPQRECVLVFGDDGGNVNVFRFLQPFFGLFDTPFKSRQGGGDTVQGIFVKVGYGLRAFKRFFEIAIITKKKQQ